MSGLGKGGQCSDDVHDFLSERIRELAQLYHRFVGRATEEAGGNFHIDVVGLGGIYMVTANEYDDVGYFSTYKALSGTWNRKVLIW